MTDENFRILDFIAAGGEGQRLRPLTIHLPKPMIPVTASRRIVDYSLESRAGGPSNPLTIVSTYYKGEKVKMHIDGSQHGITVVRDGGLGHVGGSLVEHLDVIEALQPTHVCLLAGDHYINPQTVGALTNRIKQNPLIDLAVLGTSDLGEHHVFEVDGTGRLANRPANQQLNKEANTRIASLGVYIANFQWLVRQIKQVKTPGRNHYDLRTDILFPDTKSSPPMSPHPHIVFVNLQNVRGGVWQDLGTIGRLYDHMRLVNTRDEKGNVVFPDAYVASDATISNSVVLSGASIPSGVVVDSAIVDERTHLGKNRENSSEYCTKIDGGITVFSRIKSDEQ